MDSRRFFKPFVAAILAVGLLTFGVAPAADATVSKAPTHAKNDTGWGFK
jgi:hypothetical protein